MTRDDQGRPVCTARYRGGRCNTPVHLGYTLCYQCKSWYSQEQIEAALEMPENESFRRLADDLPRGQVIRNDKLAEGRAVADA